MQIPSMNTFVTSFRIIISIYSGIMIISAGGNGKPLQYSCLENFMDQGAWQATVHGVAKSQMRLSPAQHSMLICTVKWLKHLR